VFVAISINVEHILEYERLPERALASVMLLLGVVLASIIGLIPGQSRTALGIDLLVEAVAVGALVTYLSTRRGTQIDAGSRATGVARRLMFAGGTLPFVIGAASVLAETGGGRYWTVAGIVFATAGAVANAWVLMVEILR